jgi:hypothetical protein
MLSELPKITGLFPVFLAALIASFLQSSAVGQRPRFGDSFVIPDAQMAPPLLGAPATAGQGAASMVPALPQSTYPGGSGLAPANGLPPQPGGPTLLPPLPQTTLPPGVASPPSFPQGSPGGMTGAPVLIQTQTFDPFATQPGAYAQGPPGQGGMLPGGPATNPSVVPPPFIYPAPAAPYGTNPGYNTYNGASTNSPGAWPNEFWNRVQSSEVYRLLERPRWRNTYIAPSGTRYLGWVESEIATTLTLPNFLFTSQPIRFSPGFVFNFWEGPDTMETGADLPPRTYDAFLAADYATPWDRPFGIETNLTVGVYSDFNVVNSDSLRITGLGLGWVRLNNTTTFKIGIEYLDRVDIKLLPAIGFFIYPSPDIKFDVYFPRPRLAHRLPSLGNYEMWAYLGGEYGGGSWTVERITMVGDQVDVNDIRVFGGLEWTGPRQVTGLFEVGYVFNRNLVYRSDSSTPIDMDDSFMLRAGIAF